MGTLVAGRRWYSRRPVSALGKVAAVSLIAIVAVLMAWLMLTGNFDPFALILVGVFPLFAALIATGWRWAPLLALVPAAFIVLFLGPAVSFLIQRPNTGDFAITSIIVMLAALAGVSGLAGTFRNYVRKTTTAPGWLRYFLYVIGALMLVILVLAALPDAKSGRGVASATEIHVAEFVFPAEGIRARAGEEVVLRFVNGDLATHSFDIDALAIHETLPGNTTTLVRFTPTEPGVYSFYCGIPGHVNHESGEGMFGTLTVE
jgi:plastocyanin